MSFNLEEVYERYKKEGVGALTVEEMELATEAEIRGGIGEELPFSLARKRELILDRPSEFVRAVDPFYDKHMEAMHDRLLDEVLGPYLLGEDVCIDGTHHDPKEYIGLMVRMSRDTFKSTFLGLVLYWKYCYFKIRRGIDLREAYIHQVIAKAQERGEVIRNIARDTKHEFWRLLPEMRGKHGEWDQKVAWRWPSFQSTGAAEWSFTAYGESSDKTGHHFTGITVDDWETEKSVTNETQRENSYNEYQMMDNLRDRSQKFNPRVHAGTTYHFDGTLKRIERDGGYLIWDVPAFRGSPKALFDLTTIPRDTEEGRRRLKLGIQKLEKERADDLNFPKRLDWKELYRSALGQGPHIFNCQMLLNPLPTDEQRFNAEIIHNSFIDELPSPGEMSIYVRCDPAIGVKKQNDETAILAGGVDWRGRRIPLDGWVGREKRPTEIVRKLFTLARKWQALGYTVQNIGIESVQYQEALAQLCRLGVPEREPEFHGEAVNMLMSPCPVRSIKRTTTMQKEARLLMMDGPITRGELAIWRGCPIADRMVSQLCNYPHDRDDILDVLRDMWTGVMIPPRPMELMEPKVHAEIKKLLDKFNNKGKPRMKHTHNQVRLANDWR